MAGLKDDIEKLLAAEAHLADGELPAVLITGETGTGKELVARALHFEGPRRDQSFVEINCAAIPAQLLESELFGHERGAFTDAKSRKIGLVETAEGGTLFLDEIGDLDLALQVKLLRLLEAMVSEGKFRADLFYRIRMVHLAVPALRERGDDVVDDPRVERHPDV